MPTLKEFIEQHGLTMTCEWRATNLNMIDPSPGMTHYACFLHCGRHKMTVGFSMGAAHTSEPTLPEVLDCLASDASGVENARNFEDWCSEYGYDTDSRKAERTYNICVKQANNLHCLLGDKAFQELLWKIERE